MSLDSLFCDLGDRSTSNTGIDDTICLGLLFHDSSDIVYLDEGISMKSRLRYNSYPQRLNSTPEEEW